MTTLPFAVSGDLTDWQASDTDQALGIADATVRAYCGWHIAPSITETVTVDGLHSWSRLLVLPTMHLTAVTNLIVDGVPVDIDGDTVQWSRSGVLYRDGGWTTRFRGVVVTITHGFAQTPVEVRGVVLDLAGTIQQDSRVTRTQVGQVSQQFAQVALAPLHHAVLDRYRLPTLA